MVVSKEGLVLVIGKGVGLGENQGLGWDSVLAFCFFLKTAAWTASSILLLRRKAVIVPGLHFRTLHISVTAFIRAVQLSRAIPAAAIFFST